MSHQQVVDKGYIPALGTPNKILSFPVVKRTFLLPRVNRIASVCSVLFGDVFRFESNFIVLCGQFFLLVDKTKKATRACDREATMRSPHAD